MLIVISLSVLVVRIGAVAYMMTGLAKDVARFQALSAFSGAGFTPDEAEGVVTDPARRRITSLLIRLGSAGVVTAISYLVLSFVGAGAAASWRLGILLGGLILIILLSRSERFNRLLTPLIRSALSRYTTLDLHDYANLLHLHDDYEVVQTQIEKETWLGSKTLADLNLPAEGVIVLGVLRAEGDYVGAPAPDFQLQVGDEVILYGRALRLHELSRRIWGDEAAHEAAKEAHREDLEKENERATK